jgi:hypothetical protein
LIIEKFEMGQVAVFHKGFRLGGIAGVDVDSDDLEIRTAELDLQVVQRRHFLSAWHTPGRPEIYQNGSSPHADSFAIQGFKTTCLTDVSRSPR